MKQFRRLLVLGIALLTPLTFSGAVPAAAAAPAPAAPQHAAAATAPGSVVREIKVTAIVPHHRDIIVDLRGEIIRITSNTPQDVTPDVYLLEISGSSKQPLTESIYEQYRRHVPEGTDSYGVLYDASARVAGSPGSIQSLLSGGGAPSGGSLSGAVGWSVSGRLAGR